MTPKEKAFELYKMYNNILIEDIIDRRPTYLVMTHKMAKKSALIAVEEMLDFMFLSENENAFWINYYNKVKKEIEQL